MDTRSPSALTLPLISDFRLLSPTTTLTLTFTMLMRVDSHMHTALCGHAIGAPIEYAMVAVEQGIDVTTITCHIPMDGEAFGQAGIRMRRDQLDQ